MINFIFLLLDKDNSLKYSLVIIVKNSSTSLTSIDYFSPTYKFLCYPYFRNNHFNFFPSQSIGNCFALSDSKFYVPISNVVVVKDIIEEMRIGQNQFLCAFPIVSIVEISFASFSADTAAHKTEYRQK